MQRIRPGVVLELVTFFPGIQSIDRDPPEFTDLLDCVGTMDIRVENSKDETESERRKRDDISFQDSVMIVSVCGSDAKFILSAFFTEIDGDGDSIGCRFSVFGQTNLLL